jgi:hypothetical protein
MEEFFKAAGQDLSITRAFERATALTEEFTQADSSNAFDPQFLDNAVQHPLFDDNGNFNPANLAASNKLVDPTGSNPTPDGLLGETLYLGFAPGTSFDNNSKGTVAEVADVTDTVYLSDVAFDDAADLYLSANTDGLVSAGWVEVRELSVPLPPGSGGQAGATFQSEPQTLRFPLIHDTQQARWNRILSIFGNPGKYRVFYYVQDSATGDVSPTVSSLVYKDSSANLNAPTAPTLLLPVNAGQTETNLLFDWSDSSDADLDAITYVLEVATDPGFAAQDIAYRREDIVQSYLYTDSSAGLLDDRLYYWRVTAVDTFGKRTSSATGSFQTNNGNGITGAVFATVNNFLSDSILQGAVVTATPSAGGGAVTATESAYLGAGTYYRKYGPAVYDINLSNISGFQPHTELMVDVSTDQKSFSVTLQTDDLDGDGLSAAEELALGSDPNNIDSDGDGLIDGFDGLIAIALVPGGVDFNGDGFADGERDAGILTDPTDGDSDNDGLSDGEEVFYGSDPNDNADWPFIGDGDLNGNGAPDAGDYLIAQQIVLGSVSPTAFHLAHADLYPAGTGDGIINVSDLILLLQLVQAAP